MVCRALYSFFFFQAHAPRSPVIIVGTHLDQVNVKNTGGLRKLVDELYSDSSIYPMIAAVTFLSSVSQKLTRSNNVNKLRKEIYYVATHLFLVYNKGNNVLVDGLMFIMKGQKCIFVTSALLRILKH